MTTAKLHVGTWISCFLISVFCCCFFFCFFFFKSCSVERNGPNRFHSPSCLFLCDFFFQRPFVFPNLIGFNVSHSQWNSYLHCCHPATTIICHSGYIVIKAQRYLSLTRLPMTIDVASENEDNRYCSVPRRWVNQLKYHPGAWAARIAGSNWQTAILTLNHLEQPKRRVQCLRLAKPNQLKCCPDR